MITRRSITIIIRILTIKYNNNNDNNYEINFYTHHTNDTKCNNDDNNHYCDTIGRGR